MYISTYSIFVQRQWGRQVEGLTRADLSKAVGLLLLLLTTMSVRPDPNFIPKQDIAPAGGWLKVSERYTVNSLLAPPLLETNHW